jgi:hypothetical protein
LKIEKAWAKQQNLCCKVPEFAKASGEDLIFEIKPGLQGA